MGKYLTISGSSAELVESLESSDELVSPVGRGTARSWSGRGGGIEERGRGATAGAGARRDGVVAVVVGGGEAIMVVLPPEVCWRGSRKILVGGLLLRPQ